MHSPMYEILKRRHGGAVSAPTGPKRPRRWVRHLLWLVPLLIFDVWLVARWRAGCASAPPPAQPVEALVEEPVPEPPAPWACLVFPTDQKALLDPDAPGVFQSTASGTPESALYGSVRTGSRGGRLVPTFHEGLDIAARQRDRKGQPLDAVRAVADGIVAHANRFGGNSNYGIYVVLRHDDPMGKVFTLYAHLARLAPGIKPGVAVKAGDTLGTVGHTSSSPMPLARGHLHFEIGLILNNQFAGWFRAKKLKPDHGMYHGWNLLGLDPLAFFRLQQEQPGAPFLAFLENVPSAFDVLLAARRKPDYFERYPALWIGAPPGGAIVVACSDNGVPLRGRAATAGERAALGKQKARILRVHEPVLGRNGSRLVTRRAAEWVLAQAGEQWREMLLYPQGP